MESSESSVDALSGDLLKRVADCPIQWPFQVVATMVACQSEETLPAEFFHELLLNFRPSRCEAEVTVRDTSIARSFPQLAIGDVKEVGLEGGLQRACHHLPSIFGFEQSRC